MQQPNKLDIILGIQWGDEGKGRVIDYYAKNYDIVARFGGGDNAGHTIVVGDRKLALRIVPSGALYPDVALFIGGGCVVSLAGLSAELDALAKIGIDTARVKISDRAHLVLPYHAALDGQSERDRGAAAIGTTGRGIGPAYVDKADRLGITFAQLRRPDALASKIRQVFLTRAPLLARVAEMPSEEAIVAQTLALAERIAPHVVDGIDFLHGALESGKKVLVEGAQGTLLDVGYGTYPYVTSSHTIAGGACTGLGVGPSAVGSVLGVIKAYCTRVGAGPFPSELLDETGRRLRERGAEFGVVTGRPRRCGWFDAVAARYAVRVNGLTGAIITKLDVLSGFERIGMVDSYRMHGQEVGVGAMLEGPIEPHITWFEGWNEPLGDYRHLTKLPRNARLFVEGIEQALGVPALGVSVGPERTQFVSE